MFGENKRAPYTP